MSTGEILLIVLICLSIVILVIISLILIKNKSNSEGSNVQNVLSKLQQQNEYLEKTLKNLFDSFSKSTDHENNLLMSSIKTYNDNVLSFLSKLSKSQTQQLTNIEARLNTILKDNETRLNRITDVISKNLETLQEKNEKKLEEMRQTVDEKLSSTLKVQLGQSVKIIMEGLENFSKNIGEIKAIATDFGDFKRVLTNVKTRGTWGEVQLENLLGQILSKTQYRQQVMIKKNSSERVDFAIVLPGKDKELLLPIDAKFPIEDYSRLCSASEKNNLGEVEAQKKNLENRIKAEAKSICEKYINPPTTTDFAIMYLPIEGLYAEVIQHPTLYSTLQQKYRVMVCGPTNFAALLTSLQMGFKTLAIEKSSSEIWKTLSAFKAEFSKFVDLLSKTQKKIDEAGETLEFATKKTKTIQRKLNDVADIDIGKIEESDDNLLA